MYESLMEEVVQDENLARALVAVKRNQGAPGIDHMRTTELESHLQAHWPKIRAKLLTGTWVPSPVRRVEIPKPGGGKRMLGIPTVMDRAIQQMLLQVLTPIFDPMFSEHSYGFRPGRSAQDAVRAAQQYAQGGKNWVVDLDITKFFDHVNHDILMGRVAQVIRDKRVLSLIGKYLRRGAMVDGVMRASEEGTPQGGPLSPLLANIYLDALDQELERRRHCFCRYADDCNIYVSSEAAAQRTLISIQSWIESICD
jgi:RNA-directed DNA polymerase